MAEQIASSAGNENKQSPAVSRGERIFDWITYGGIAGIGTYLLSIPMGYGIRHVESLKPTIEWASKGLQKIGFTKTAARDVVMTTALMQGGNATIPFVKAMEKHKPELVCELNKKLGDSCDIETIKEEPKQTWGSLVSSRLIAWAAVFASLKGTGMLIGDKRFEQFEETFSKKLFCNPFKSPTHIEGRETTRFKVGKIAAIDFFATIASTVLLYVGSKSIARFVDEKHHHQSAGSDGNGNSPSPVETVTSDTLSEGKSKQAVVRGISPQSSHADRLYQSSEQNTALVM